MKKRVVFLGTPDFAKAHLQALLASDVYEVVAVLSQPDRPSGRKMKLQKSPVKELAEAHTLPVLTPVSLRKSPETLEKLKAWQPDVIIVVAYGQILSKEYLEAFPDKIVNVHGSLLPRWRGAAPIQRAIMAGDTTTGVCLQVMVEALDAGAVIGERRLKITETMTAIDLHEDMKALGAQLLIQDLPQYLVGQVKPQPQDEKNVTYAKKIEKAEAFIDWSLEAEQIFNSYRGLQLGPGVRTQLSGKGLKITKMALADKRSQASEKQPFGSVQKLEKTAFHIQCGAGQIEILEVQPESKKRMSVEDFLKGYQLNVGDCLGDN